MPAPLLPASLFAQLGARAALSAARLAIPDASPSRRGTQINLKTNYQQMFKRLNKIQRKQLPFAYSKTINDTIKAIRKRIVFKTHPKAFDVKNKNFAKAAYRMAFSNKRKLVGAVFDRLEKEYLVLQAKGGIKHKQGRYLAVPTRERRPIKSKRTYESVKPKALLKKPKHFVNRVRSGQLMILKRKTKKRRPLQGLYILHETNAVIDKVFKFYEDAEKVAKQQFDRRFKVNFSRALKSARR